MTDTTRLIIAVDCDDVIVDTSPALIEYYNRTYSTHLELKDMYADSPAWDVKTEEEAILRCEEFLRTDEFQKVAPAKETVASIKRIAEVHELHLVTGRSDFLEAATMAMVELYFPKVFASVEHTGMYGEKPRSKGDVCVQIKADVMIDDHIRHAEQVAERGIHVLLFGDYPWNQRKTLPKYIRRVKDWAEVERILL